MDIIDEPLIGEPPLWTLVFSRETRSRWVRWVVWGKYKHVRAYGYIPGMKAWVLYDVHFNGTSLAVVKDGDAVRAVLVEWMTNADLMRIRRVGPARRFPVFFCCTSAISHLIGLPGGTLRPDALWRDALRNGGEPFEAATAHGKTSAIRAATA